MNASLAESVTRRYADLLIRCDGGVTETVLQDAYELGRWAWGQGMGVVAMTHLHHHGLAIVLDRQRDPKSGRDTVGHTTRNAALVAAESVSVFEMAMRGFQESNAVLLEANRRLESANEELDAFSYSVSHDLRAPLRAIDGYGQLMQDDLADSLDPRSQDHLRRIRAAARRMSELIDDLLRLSRISRMDLEVARVSLSELAEAVVADLKRRDAGRDVTVAIERGLIVDADPKLLRIVLENLLGNAWKFTGKTGRASIEVRAAQREGVESIVVRDNGAGFDPHHVSRLFRPFHRLHAESDFPGTGVGLAIVHRIILRHGGCLWAESELGRGAAFFLYLPRQGRDGGS